jgi:thioredoxin 1
MNPVLAELADDVGNRAKVFTVEIGTNENLTEKYGVIVVPTLIVFDGGNELYRIVGLKSKKSLREALAV